ncbi:MAG: aldehyde ferredoxin oxidoreductase family protein [Chloroflexi bacterium]|nr:aldehyde ferredoxin oxidoreductase family protein [Chloroflexota bacterium]
MINGYTRLAHVDLTKRRVEYEEINSETARKFIGGSGMAARYLSKNVSPRIEPLSPDNPLLFMTGPLTGTSLPASSRYTVAGISPATGIWGRATSGGGWADELRHSGFDGIIITGASQTPVYLFAQDGKIVIRDAGKFWGRDAYQVSSLLQKETDPEAVVACIGRAGEKLVNFAGVMNDGPLGRIAARCGFGALMGSKKLKAIVVRGKTPLTVHNEAALKSVVKEIFAAHPVKKIDAHDIEMDIGLYHRFFDIGGVPIKNWREGSFEAGKKLPEELRKVKPYLCRRCPYGCGESYLTDEGERHMVAEHWAPLGTNCLIDDAVKLQQAYAHCQRYGMDTTSVGDAIAFAMECYEKGLITRKDADGLELTWGNGDAAVELTRKIGEREGLGNVLADGVRKAAQKIGGTAPEYAIHVKGLECPLHEPRAGMGWAVAYATANIGATQCESVGASRVENYTEGIAPALPDLGYSSHLTRFAIEGKGELVARGQNVGAMMDSFVVCHFLVLRNLVSRQQFVDFLNGVTGWDMDVKEFTQTGERIFNLIRMINVRRGISRKDDTLPPRLLTHRRGSGGAANSLPFLGTMLNDYYKYRQWSEEGIPTPGKLAELGLSEL